MPTDVLTLVSKVVNRAVEKSGYVMPSAPTGMDDGHGAELLVDTLASHLLAFLGIGSSGNGAPGHPSTNDLERICAEQMARNSILARALGACDCWGELAACAVCRGRGGPGWRPPDRASFDALVRPVLRKMKQHRLRVGGAPVVAL